MRFAEIKTDPQLNWRIALYKISETRATVLSLNHLPIILVLCPSYPCFGPLKLCQYLLTNGVAKNGTETVFG